MENNTTTVDPNEVAKELILRLFYSNRDHTVILRKQGDLFTIAKQSPKEHLTWTEAAKELGISPPTLRRNYVGKHIERKPRGFLRQDVIALRERMLNGSL